jgi:hypothetical protein
VKKNRIFSFIVKNFGFLKTVPLLPYLFDSWLKIWTFVSRAELLDWLDEIEAEVLKWEGTSISMHKYGGMQFNCNGKEIGHLHSNGLLDVLFSRKVKDRLLTDGRIEPHHVFENSGWISFYLESFDDKKYAQNLLFMSYLRIINEHKS